MNQSRWQQLKNYDLRDLPQTCAQVYRRLVALLRIASPDEQQLRRRITIMERDMFLPLKAALIAMLIYSFYHKRWIYQAAEELGIFVEWTSYFLWYYIPANIIAAGVLLNLRRLPLGLVQWVVFAAGLLDAIFLSALTVLTGGYSSFLYWLFLALIVRSAVSVPRATSQLALNFTIMACYFMAGVIHISIATSLKERRFPNPVIQRSPQRTRTTNEPVSRPDFSRYNRRRPQILGSNAPPALATTTNLPAATNLPPLSPATNSPLALTNRPSYLEAPASEVDEFGGDNSWLIGSAESSAEPLMVRLALLLLLAVCSYGVQVLMERQRKAEEEAREFALREGQLHSAGRLSAEFVHQMKNPLAIINSAAYSLQRALNEGRPSAAAHIKIIQEEVEHTDRIITQIMGYAQLSEGRVERLDVLEELDRAIAQVFPPGAGYGIQIHRDYAGQFPPLLMLRRHASDAFVNVLQNAREALGAKKGNVFVTAHCRSDYSIEVSIRDDGPGIPADKQDKIFQAYYTTKEKGTGLGLATVKHNVELYGGSVSVESELGKGARFILIFPGRTQFKPVAHL